ncbi:unnamed protein product [Moneuplotes crassus]|uniref:Uncharacterized protein n=1 Tax=Euplotes crassus TaxID=5936 RepID=A0AAD1X552_EUPCR|nr:unnamed protein product [Moneuplotes crassus]
MKPINCKSCCRLTITLSILLLWMVTIRKVAATTLEWDFDSNPDFPIFQSAGPNANITISSTDHYLKFENVETTDLDRDPTGMVVLNSQNIMEITDGTFATDESYTVYMELYIYKEAYNSTLFCKHLNLYTNIGSGNTVRWCIRIEQASNTFHVYSETYDDDERWTNNVTYSNATISGWHAFRFTISCPGSCTNYLFYTNITGAADGTFIGQESLSSTSVTDYHWPKQYFGQFKNETGSVPASNFFVGMIDRLVICDSDPNDWCGEDPSILRNQLIEKSKLLYEYHWPLNDAYNSYHESEFRQVSYEKIRHDSGQDNLVFYNDDNLRVVYPTNNGWVSLYRDSWIRTESFPFNNAIQFTIEFEFLKFKKDTSFEVFPWADDGDDWSQFRGKYYYLMTASSKKSFHWCDSLDGAKWTKSIISYTYSDEANKIYFGMGRQILKDIGDPSATDSKFLDHHVDGGPMWGLNSATMSIRIKNLRGIIRNVKYYPWALNGDTFKNHGNYTDPSNSGWEYQEDLDDDYFVKFREDKKTISNADNACLNYFTAQSELCKDLTHKKKEYCSEGFRDEYYHCIDRCGDGIVQMSPRMLECDDGNTDENDGCSKSCTIEDDWVCKVDPILNNKSYCQPTCGSGTLEDPEECDDGNNSNGDGCETNCTITNKYSCEEEPGQPSYCTPACGNSEINPEYDEKCDDGNNMDFDGCDKDCQIELNYVCHHEVGKPDNCTTEFSRPVIVSDKFDETTNTITIGFDQEMMNQEINETSLLLFIESPNTEIYFTFTTKFEGKNFIVNFTPSPPFVGGIGEIITLTLKEIAMFKSNNSIPMLSGVAFTYAVPAFPVSGSAESSGKGASYTFVLTIGASLGVSMLTGGSAETMWSLANTLQILFFMGLIELEYTSDLENTFKIMAYSNFDNPLTKYVTSVVFFGVQFINSPVSTNFESLGFESTNILVNSFDKIGMICILLFSAIILSCIYKKVKDSNSRTARCIKKVDKSIRYESFTRFVVELILNLSVASWINIWYGSMSSIEDIIALVVSNLTLLGMLMLIVYGIYYPVYHFEDIKMNPVTHERHCLLFLDFKKDKIKQLLYFGFFMIRRILFAFVIVCMKEDPKKQLILCFFMFAWQLYYCVLNKPYISTINNVLNVYNELILILFTCLLFLFTETNDAKTITRIGWACIGVIIVFFLINWAIIFPSMIYSMLKSCKKKKFDKSVLDEGGPLSHKVLNPISKAFQKPGFSVEEFRKKLEASQAHNTPSGQITIKKVPAISRKHLDLPSLPSIADHNRRLYRKTSFAGSPDHKPSKIPPVMDKF